MSTAAAPWYDAHVPGRPTPPGSTYTVLMDFISPEMAASFRAIYQDEKDEALWETGQRVAPGYSRLNLMAYLAASDERRRFIERTQARLARHIDAAPGEWNDCWLLRYLPGAGIRDHVDPVPGRDAAPNTRYRLNVLLTHPDAGGDLFIEGRPVHLNQHDGIVFSSGSLIHRVEPTRGLRLVLSLGMTGPKEAP